MSAAAKGCPLDARSLQDALSPLPIRLASPVRVGLQAWTRKSLQGDMLWVHFCVPVLVP